MKLLQTIFLLVILTACALNKNVPYKRNKSIESPPNGYQMDSNFFCDETEVKNLDWLEYMFWNRHIFGLNSDQFLAVNLDTGKWDIDSCLSDYKEYYLRHPATRDYPVVGVSQEQAIQYSKWRRDRVLEQLLIRDGYLDHDNNQTPENYFTTEKYFAGEYKGITPDSNVLYPDFRLPTQIERNYILKFVDSIRANKKIPKKKSERYLERYGTIVALEIQESDSCKYDLDPMSHVYKEYTTKSYEIVYHLRGNVCEWGDSTNVCFGGSWGISMDTILKRDIYTVTDTSNIFTGFRNVCEWKYWNYDK